MLEARSVELSPALAPLPDEQSIDAQAGIVKVGGGLQATVAAGPTALARVTFRVLSTERVSELKFHRYGQADIASTAITPKTGKSVPLLAPSTLVVQLGSTLAPVAAGQAATSASAASTDPSVFASLQVQGMQVTTKDNSIFVAWATLPSGELKGYNVYYGTTPGRYIQRRSVPATSSTVALQDLSPATQYFLAVRAYNLQDQESAFSQEVAVVVGRPETSNAPLSGYLQRPVQGNPIQTRGGQVVTGETGMHSTIAILLLVSACIGTAFACRRQFAFSQHTLHAS